MVLLPTIIGYMLQRAICFIAGINNHTLSTTLSHTDFGDCFWIVCFIGGFFLTTSKIYLKRIAPTNKQSTKKFSTSYETLRMRVNCGHPYFWPQLGCGGGLKLYVFTNCSINHLDVVNLDTLQTGQKPLNNLSCRLYF